MITDSKADVPHPSKSYRGNKKMNMPIKNIVGNIQLLRVIAAFFVITVHMDKLFNSVGVSLHLWGGVDIFFVISGFIMVHTTKNAKISAATFFINRITRIIPLYWAITFMVYLVSLLAPFLLQGTSSDVGNLIKSLFFIPFQRPDGRIAPDLFVGWSINYEMFFYVIFTIGLMASRYKTSLATIGGMLALLVIFGSVTDSDSIVINFYTRPLMLEFVFGMIIAFCTNLSPINANGPLKVGIIGFMAIGFISIIMGPILLPQTPHLLLYGIPSTIIVFTAVLLEKCNVTIRNPLVLLLGNATYSIYLTHPFVTQAFQMMGEKVHATGSLSVALIAMTLFCVSVVGIAVHYFIENPLCSRAKQTFSILMPIRKIADLSQGKVILFAFVFLSVISTAPYVLAQDTATPTETLLLQIPNDPVSLSCAAVKTNASLDQSAKLQRSFLDDFQGTSVSPYLWRTYYYNDSQKLSGRTLPANSEKEIYVDPNYTGSGVLPLGLNPFHFKNGVLSITAQRTPANLLDRLYKFPYISGTLSSLGSFKQTYGYFEIRARLPRGKALWPAFWLVEPNQWPPEIDVFESMDGQHPEYIAMTTHWKDPASGRHKMSACSVSVPGVDTEFHLYGALWTKERIIYYIDRKPIGAIKTPPGLNRPMHILANLAIESIADETTPKSASYAIDWIVAYRLLSEPSP